MAILAFGWLLIMWGIATIISSFQGKSIIDQFKTILNFGMSKK